MTKDRPRHNHTYYKRIAREKARCTRDPALAVCWICGEPIDMALPHDHKRAFTLDHVVPIARGGRVLDETRYAHRDCNSARGGGRTATTATTAIEW
ncbi:Hypothetical protein CGLY_07350 [Corynebacterium glyciniphilum AJ 3170]|uniref:HNH nuclease domain-containing protein n=1 Tax=Corynebacterium glyciniphilum AJ 3170 TaxID=1404245 RepID=X5E909_9CORY|nr:HNH endonuclease [Corynebacterium glyciniphilum]AHW63915.1 Hypothetical protein CGLY_07350 [Corynebacterium glyciniphilum AJ 3170]